MLYRVQKAEEILGRGLARDKLRHHLALYLSQLLGLCEIRWDRILGELGYGIVIAATA